MKDITKKILGTVIAIVVIAALFSNSLSPFELTGPEQISFSTLVEKVNEGEVKSISTLNDTVTVELEDGTTVQTTKEPQDSLVSQLADFGVNQEQLQSVSITNEKESGTTLFLTALLPFLIPFVLIALFIYMMMKQAQGANSRAMMFGQARARQANPQDNKKKTTFKDVAGVKEAKEELSEIVEFLKNPKKFLALGARIPKGVLLVGQPGIGKTLLARAVAGEADVPFFTISGSEFVEMFVGVGASRVRDLFKKAKAASPCIIFIDELDAVGRQRGAGLGGSNDEREQTLNQILVEMDGFDVTTNVIIMAATNRPDILDKALLRPGRFDRRVVIDAPDINDREAILKVHARKKPLADDVDLRRVAERTAGFTGADLDNLLNEAALLAARRDKKKIELIEVLESIEKVILGPERKSHILSDKEKKVTAYHEAGHALVAHVLPHADPVHKVSIISRGSAGGYTLTAPSEDKKMHYRSEFIDRLAVLLAGYTVEKEVFGELSTGASNDLRVATRLARRLITEFGMSEELGARTFGEREEMIFLGREIHEQRDYSEKVAEKIDGEISKFIADAITTAHRVITEHKSKLDAISETLMQKETIEKDDFNALMDGKPLEEQKKPVVN